MNPSIDPDTAASLRYLATVLGEEKLRKLLATVATRQAQRLFEEESAVHFAVRLLAQRVDRTLIRDRLMAAYRLTERTAYRRIDSALKFCQREAFPGRPPAHAPGIETTDQG